MKEFDYNLWDRQLPSNFKYEMQDFDIEANEYIIRSNMQSFAKMERG